MNPQHQSQSTYKRLWLSAYEKLQKVQADAAKLALEEAMLLDELRFIAQSYQRLTGKPLNLTPEQAVFNRGTVSIGDLLEAMLKERGPLDKRQVLDELVKAGKIVGKNGRIVLANAIKRDKDMRFKVENGKVALTDHRDRFVIQAERLSKRKKDSK